MVGPKWLKLGGLVEHMRENILAKGFFGSALEHQDQVDGSHIPSSPWG